MRGHASKQKIFWACNAYIGNVMHFDENHFTWTAKNKTKNKTKKKKKRERENKIKGSNFALLWVVFK